MSGVTPALHGDWGVAIIHMVTAGLIMATDFYIRKMTAITEKERAKRAQSRP